MATEPLFGNGRIVLLIALVGLASFIAGRALARRQPAPTPPIRAEEPSAQVPPSAPAPLVGAAEIPPPEILAIIAAAVRVTFGDRARIAQVVPHHPIAPAVETLMQQWSMEGRRQIYSSHQIR